MSTLNLDPNNMPETQVIAATIEEFLGHLTETCQVNFNVLKLQKAIFEGEINNFRANCVPDHASELGEVFFRLDAGIRRLDSQDGYTTLFRSSDESVLDYLAYALNELIKNNQKDFILLDSLTINPFSESIIAEMIDALVSENPGNTLDSIGTEVLDNGIVKSTMILGPESITVDFYSSVSSKVLLSNIGTALEKYKKTKEFKRLMASGTMEIAFHVSRKTMAFIHEEIHDLDLSYRISDGMFLMDDVYAVNVCEKGPLTVFLDAGLGQEEMSVINDYIRALVYRGMAKVEAEGPCECCSIFKGPIDTKQTGQSNLKTPAVNSTGVADKSSESPTTHVAFRESGPVTNE